MIDILKDIKNGNLPAEEIPSFALYLLGRNLFWVFFSVIIIGGLVALGQ